MINPKISIIIPVYNVEKHLCKCLDSVLNQSYENLEIILIDDGSIDKSYNICDEYAAKDKRIRCEHQGNKGVSFARNRGIELATGDYLHFLDSDDYMDPDAYEYLVDLIDRYKVDAVGFEYYTTFLSGEDIPHRIDNDRYGYRDRKGTLYEHLFGSSNFLCTKLIPARKTSGLRLRTDIYRDEDTLYGVEALSQVNSCYFTDRALLHYVQSEDSACRGSFRKNQLTALKVIPIMEEIISCNYPEWLNKWRGKYLHLMTTLYRDMYMDANEYENEMNMVHKAFIELWNKGGKQAIDSWKNRIKLGLFKINPNLYCKASKKINNL